MDQLFFHRSHQSFSIGIAFGIVVTGKRLLDAKQATSLDKGGGRGLGTVVGHQMQPHAPCPFGKLGFDGLIEGMEPISCRGLKSCMMTDDFLRMPIEDDHDINPSRWC
jgi:hypothetical protein